jgi:hypothetical protein
MASTIAPAPAAVRPPAPSAPAGRTVGPLLGWTALIVGAVVWGVLIGPPGRPDLTQPLVGALDLRLTAWALPAAAVAVLGVAGAGRLSRLASWRWLLAATFGLAAAWAVGLALADGPAALARPLMAGQEPLAAVPLVGDPLEFLRTFTDRIARYPVHVEGHPPGTVIALWALERIGLGAPVVVAALAIGLASSAAPAALLAVRELTGEATARRAAPFLALAPFAVWVATSLDAAYLGIGAWAVTLVVLASGRTGNRARAVGALGGALLGMGLLLSYGLALLALVPAAVARHRRRPDVLAWAALGGAVPLAAAALAGFWWPDGLAATGERYALGIARLRPYGYFLVANLAALAIALGPAVAPALARLRDRRLWLPAGAGIAAIAIADLSGLSKGEVERIWLPFMPWVLVATAAFGSTEGRGWLAGQAALGLTIQIGWRSLW